MIIPGLDVDFEAWQKRLDNCDFVFPDEYGDFFDDLAGRLTDALSARGESQWQFTLPIDKGAMARRNWLDKALRIIGPLAAEGRIDFGPLRWFERYIHGDEPRDSEKAKLAFDALRSIRLNVLGEDGQYLRIRELEPTDASPDDDNATLKVYYLPGEIMAELDVSPPTLRKYAKAAGIKKLPGVGRKDQGYSPKQRLAIFKYCRNSGRVGASSAKAASDILSNIEAESVN